MAAAEFRESLAILAKNPVLWIPGIVGGVIGAGMWLLYALSGTFFVSKLLVILALVILFLIAGMIQVISDGQITVRSLITGGGRSFFRILLPQLVIIFVLMLILTIIVVPLTLAGISSDQSLISLLFVSIAVPLFMLTFFFDTAAVFENRHVFDSIARSVQIVVQKSGEVASFYLLGAGFFFGLIFSMMILWEAFLYNQLQPLMNYNETQIQAISPDQIVAMIGPSGMWITAGLIFLGVTILIPVLYSYKVCFFRAISGGMTLNVQQIGGEYDSKGRWYKY